VQIRRGGAAIDYSGSINAALPSGGLLDSTPALMVSKDLDRHTRSNAESEIDAKAKAYFAALYTADRNGLCGRTINATYTTKNRQRI